MAREPTPTGRLRLPTDQMKRAYNLRRSHGMTDSQIAEVLGCSREWACKLRGEYRRRVNGLLAVCAEHGDGSSLLPALLN